MSDFMELNFPKRESVGKWCIWAAMHEKNGMWCSLIADGSGDLKPPCSHEEFKNDHMFNTEEDAHVAANYYYSKHSRAYPFMHEWLASITVPSVKGATSQVMEFE